VEVFLETAFLLLETERNLPMYYAVCASILWPIGQI